MAHESVATVVGQLVGMGAEQGCNLGLDGLRQQRSRAVAQNLGQGISKSSWLGELENVSVAHGVSLLRWRSGGQNNPHDTPPYLFMPSPAFAHSSFTAAAWSGLRPAPESRSRGALSHLSRSFTTQISVHTRLFLCVLAQEVECHHGVTSGSVGVLAVDNLRLLRMQP